MGGLVQSVEGVRRKHTDLHRASGNSAIVWSLGSDCSLSSSLDLHLLADPTELGLSSLQSRTTDSVKQISPCPCPHLTALCFCRILTYTTCLLALSSHPLLGCGRCLFPPSPWSGRSPEKVRGVSCCHLRLVSTHCTAARPGREHGRDTCSPSWTSSTTSGQTPDPMPPHPQASVSFL